MKEECEHEGTVAQVENCINLESLPETEDRDERIIDNFDDLEPGRSLIVIDDYQLDWLEELLADSRPDEFDRRFFHLHKEAGRNEACVKKRASETSSE